ncbi:MAG: hypothetical protein LKK07_10215 [Lactococcus lactis]|jgi:hypothetical protein|nr:hypothetical protein [Lactococcus lactis]MCI2139068.1 hypothetical protein [Lactococcus lactis]MCI2188851.1 hypothetical protein [Lactococcus lactis]
MKWTEKYKCGFSNGLNFESVEFLLDVENSNETKLFFKAYDANLYPLPDASTWSKKWLKKQVKFLNTVVSKDFIGEVWLDDVLVRSV